MLAAGLLSRVMEDLLREMKACCSSSYKDHLILFPVQGSSVPKSAPVMVH